MNTLDGIDVGDVVAVRDIGLIPKLIQIGAVIRGIPADVNHVAVVHHQDKNTGVWWGLEGRPGGVGWADMRNYLGDSWTVANTGQPKTTAQRVSIAGAVQQMLGTPYDWMGIGADACRDLGIPDLFARDWRGKGAPGHVVCSSLAAYVYGKVGLARPMGSNGGRLVQPGDWAGWIQHQGWQA